MLVWRGRDDAAIGSYCCLISGPWSSQWLPFISLVRSRATRLCCMRPRPWDVELIRRRGRSSSVIGMAGIAGMTAMAASRGRAVGLAVMVGYHPPEGRGVRLSLGFLEGAVNGLELFLAGLRMSDQRDQTLAVECYTYLVVQIFRPPFWNQVLIQFPAVVSQIK